MAYWPGAEPPESDTVVRKTTWVGVPLVESISTSRGASWPLTVAPESWGGMAEPGAIVDHHAGIAVFAVALEL